MLDQYNRNISYLRISVTDRCNLRCQYCMPEDGLPMKSHTDILSFEEIVEAIKVGVKLGINKVRLTGGEPLIRKGISDLIAQIHKIPGIKDIGLTTNGILLQEMAKDLKEAGLKRVNISLDTLDEEKYAQITRIGKLSDVLNGIQTVKKLGFDPVKINFVRIKGVNEEDEEAVKAFCKDNNLKLRFIRQMDLLKGEFEAVEGGEGGVCSICNRLRLTADGFIIPCLFSDYGFSIREMGIEEAYYKALNKKPESGEVSRKNTFYNTGG